MRKGIIRKTVSSALALLLAGTMLGSLVQPGLDVEAAKAADNHSVRLHILPAE